MEVYERCRTEQQPSSPSSSPLRPAVERAKRVILQKVTAYYDNDVTTFVELESELENARLVETENGYGFYAVTGFTRR